MPRPVFWPALRLAVLLAALAGGAMAQETPAEETPAETPAAETPATEPPTTETAAEATLAGIDYDGWHRSAQRTATITENGNGSSFALERLRSDLVTWRNRFAAAQEANASRIATVEAQIAALGEAPAEGSEDSRVTTRRTALQAELARLRAPVQLAEEAYAQANGLIAEIDGLLRLRRTEVLLTRGDTPLNPVLWPTIAESLTGLIGNLWKEASVTFRSSARLAVLNDSLGGVLIAAIGGLVCLFRGRRWIGRLSARVTARTRRGDGVWQFLFSLAQLVVPYLGLSFLVAALTLSGLPGFRLGQILQQIPNAGAFAIFAHWLADRLFGPGARIPLPEDFGLDGRERGWRLVVGMGWLLTAGGLVQAVLDAGEVETVAAMAAILPVHLALSWLLFRFGRELLWRPAPAADGTIPDAPGFGRGLVSLLGRAVMAVAVVGPVLTAIGYAVAYEALTYPTAMTLALIGVVLVLQTFVFDLYVLIVGGEEGARDALLPVIGGVLLTVVALPAGALFWGVRGDDLSELWTRFREGWTFGDTRISPTDFLSFVVLFIAGYLVTRLLQGVLRTTILPKTRLDPGGRTAIISGTGYLGIFLSAVFAVTAVGLDLSNLAIVAGALSVGIGFGLQNIVSNFISGIILLIERPISEGDWIEVGGKMGYVRDISVRSTRIETFDRTNVIVPNADLISGQVTNWTRGSAVGRVIAPVSVMFGTDIARVMAILKEVAESHPMVLLNPAPSVVLQNFGPDVLNFEIRAIVRDVNFGLSIRSEMNIEIAKRFYDEGIEFAGNARANGAAGRTAQSPKPGPGEMRVTLIRPEETSAARPADDNASDPPPEEPQP